MARPRLIRLLALLTTLAVLGGAGVAAAVYLYLEPRLPSIALLQDVRLQVPLRVYSREGRLIAEFGEKRRIPVQMAQVPEQLVAAFLAAEDDRFYQHPGVDYQGLLRAGFELIRTGEKRQGGSTITMQVARNFFLSSEKTYLRKLNEILLALKIERQLEKPEILELYLNKIYLGQRAYGIGAAAQIYYGKTLEQLTLAEMATLAGLPKAPSRDNPVSNPRRALERRNYVLARMRDLGSIDAAEYTAAREAGESARLHDLPIEVDAPYVAEMVRREMIDRFGDQAYTEGLSVFTTLDGRHQEFANAALRQALLDYDQRHGYRGPERRVDLGSIDEQLAGQTTLGGLLPAAVIAADEATLKLRVKGVGEVEIGAEGWRWARPRLDENRRGTAPKRADELLAPGDLVRVSALPDDGWTLAQVPEIEGAFVALRPGDGAITALVGGYDFLRSKFNRVIQARRQPGSGFKPVIYSAALEHGFTTASLINDAPVVFDDPSLEATWRPENYSGKFYGPTRLRQALINSRNLVSIRLLQAIGVDTALAYAGDFGIDTTHLPHNLSLALGSGALAPLDVARIYAVFANGGFRVDPYLIERVEDRNGLVIEQSSPAFACAECEPPATASPQPATNYASAGTPAAGPASADPAAPPAPATLGHRLAPRVVEPRNAYLMYTLMRDVVRFGTARRARELGRDDIAGKTGTTNDQRDAWFNGFHPNLVATAWVGFDDFSPLGNRETGGRAALPMWMQFMQGALDGVPSTYPKEPAGLVRVRIDPETGQLAAAGQDGAVFELFRVEERPTLPATGGTTAQPAVPGGPRTAPEQLF